MDEGWYIRVDLGGLENSVNVDIENSSQQADLNNWLPITASRKAKWWYSAFHNVTAMVGAGVLGLPIPGISALVVSWLITFYSLWQLVELHEVVDGKRFDRYPELGQHAFGPKLGYWMVMPQQMMVQVATDIVYMVTGGVSLKKFVDLLIPSLTGARLSYFIVFFGVLQLLLSQTPNLNSLKGVSLLAAIIYSMVAFVASAVRGGQAPPHHHVNYGLRSHTTAGRVFDFFNALGTIAFAFAGHSVALEIQATIPSTPEKPSKKPMWLGAGVAYAIVAMCYIPVALTGFWAFGNTVEDDILLSLEKPSWLIALANLMVFFHVLGSYQVFAMSVFDGIESYLVEKKKFKPGRWLRLISRSIYLPCIMWLVLKRPRRWTFHWFASWISIIIGVLITILAPIGGARQIILSAKTYKFFS
ncbi:Amino acid transporter, transmembrane domain [Dillenia turbinata]|uniref:Amino acid transporter, transmembrane domain n=1 Tax=Dillenia turbinata TaxID=194707 RepID=A0AAN8YYK0_9MAGN